MLKKGDLLSIGLIFANVIFVCLFVMKGTITTSGTFTEYNASVLVPSHMPMIEPAVTDQPSSTMTLAVNEGALLFAEIRSQPRSGPPTSSPTPVPAPTVTPTVTPAPSSKEAKNDDVPHESKPSYKTALDNKPIAKEAPSHDTVSKPHPKHHS